MGAVSAVWWLQRCEGHFISRVVIVIQRSRRRLLEAGGRSLYRANGSPGFPHWLHHNPVCTSLHCENSKWRAGTGKFMSAVSKRVFKSSGPTAACLIWLLMIDSEKKRGQGEAHQMDRKSLRSFQGSSAVPRDNLSQIEKLFPRNQNCRVQRARRDSYHACIGAAGSLTGPLLNCLIKHPTISNHKNIPVNYNKEI